MTHLRFVWKATGYELREREGEAPSVGEQVEEDDRGTPPGWIATKLYGNVQLQWFTDERELGERWELLDRVLADLAPR